ncbi:MAG: hypothetical protein ACK5U6_13830 [Pseudanabaena sp.]|jgi:hypothetical protein|nr:hypothetical protein [Pseudanabaena sp. M007S1SP1A06QC]
MAQNYDERILREFADRLYNRANFIVLGYTVLGGLIGVIAFASLFPGLFRSNESLAIMITSVIGGSIGCAMGSEKAFWLKLQAQTALCQAQIERNTRG